MRIGRLCTTICHLSYAQLAWRLTLPRLKKSPCLTSAAYRSPSRTKGVTPSVQSLLRSTAPRISRIRRTKSQMNAMLMQTMELNQSICTPRYASVSAVQSKSRARCQLSSHQDQTKPKPHLEQPLDRTHPRQRLEIRMLRPITKIGWVSTDSDPSRMRRHVVAIEEEHLEPAWRAHVRIRRRSHRARRA